MHDPEAGVCDNVYTTRIKTMLRMLVMLRGALRCSGKAIPAGPADPAGLHGEIYVDAAAEKNLFKVPCMLYLRTHAQYREHTPMSCRTATSSSCCWCQASCSACRCGSQASCSGCRCATSSEASSIGGAWNRPAGGAYATKVSICSMPFRACSIHL